MCEILKTLDEQIANAELEYHNEPNNWRVIHKLGNAVANRVDKMKELGKPGSDVVSFAEKYTYLPKILIRYAEELYLFGRKEMAVAALEKGKLRDSADKVTVCSYSKKLIDLYEACGMLNKLKDELAFQLTECSQTDLTYYEKLKNLTSENEW